MIIVASGWFQRERTDSIKFLFGVYILPVTLFICFISIIKYCIKRRRLITALLVPAKCWCYFFYWDTLIAAQFIWDIKASVLYVKQRKRLLAASYLQLSQLPLQDGSGIPAAQQNVWTCHIVKSICRYSVALQTWIYHNYIKWREMH